MAKYCPNLTTFSSYVDSNEINHLIALFTLCTKLTTVTLTGPCSPEIDVDDLFLQLSRQDLPNLKEIINISAWSFTPKALCQFLTLLHTLSIDNCHFTDDHLNVVIRSLQSTLKTLRLRLHISDRLNESCKKMC